MEESSSIKAYHELSVKLLTVVCVYQEKIYDRLYLTVDRPDLAMLPAAQEQRSPQRRAFMLV